MALSNAFNALAKLTSIFVFFMTKCSKQVKREENVGDGGEGEGVLGIFLK